MLKLNETSFLLCSVPAFKIILDIILDEILLGSHRVIVLQSSLHN